MHWDPPGGSLPVGEVSSLQLVFDDCSPEDTPAPPKVDGLRLDYQGQSSNISIINGTFSRNVTMTYAALLTQQQEVDIPAFTVKTNKGPLRVPAAHFSAAGATVGSSGDRPRRRRDGTAGALARERVGGRGVRPQVLDRRRRRILPELGPRHLRMGPEPARHRGLVAARAVRQPTAARPGRAWPTTRGRSRPPSGASASIRRASSST